MDSRTVMEICAAAYLFSVAIEFLLRRRWLVFGLELAVLLVVLAIALLLNNSVNGTIRLGEEQSPLVSILILFGATVLGIAARYFFYLKSGEFSWLGLVKPAMISPLVMIPLIASVQTMTTLNATQLVSFGLLAFQNGFFWKTVLDSARPITKARREP